MVQSRPVHEVHLQRGLTNPEYKGIQQDLPDVKKRLQGYAGLKGYKVGLSKNQV
jgi:hypothetical protein